MKRKIFAVCLIFVLLLSLTSCMRVEETVIVNKDGSVDLRSTVGLNNELAAMMTSEESAENPMGLTDEDIKEFEKDGYTYEDFSDKDGYAGYTVSKDGVDMASAKLALFEITDLFTVDGKHVVFSVDPFAEDENDYFIEGDDDLSDESYEDFLAELEDDGLLDEEELLDGTEEDYLAEDDFLDEFEEGLPDEEELYDEDDMEIPDISEEDFMAAFEEDLFSGLGGEGSLDDLESTLKVLKANGSSLSIKLVLPVKPTKHNATSVSEDGKTLTWELTDLDANEKIYAEFDLPSDDAGRVAELLASYPFLKWLVPAVGGLLVAGIITIIAVAAAKKKKRNAAKKAEQAKAEEVPAEEQPQSEAVPEEADAAAETETPETPADTAEKE
ncbi:MAG: hypothetical protein IJL87_02460 [Clostridia bacterium]|nr:hypothetical protein [Clostridia bacterium]